MKRKYSFAIVLLLTVIAMVTKKIVLPFNIEQILFVPYTFYFFILLTNIRPRYIHVFGFTITGLLISIIKNSTPDIFMFFELATVLAGALITFISVAIYKRYNRSESKTKQCNTA